MRALDTDSFDLPFKFHDLRDFIKVVASSEAVLADFRSQMLDRIRIRPDSAHGQVVSSSKGCLPCCRPFLALTISLSWTRLQTHPSPQRRSMRFRSFLG